MGVYLRRIGTVAIVLAGLYMIVQAVLVLGQAGWFVAVSAEDPTMIPQLVALVVALGLLVGLGFFLIGARHRLAARWFEEDGEAPTVGPVDAADILRVALVVIGLGLLGTAAIRLVSTSLNWFVDAQLQADAGIDFVQGVSQKVNSALSLVTGVFQAGLGLLLVMRSGAVSRWLWGFPRAREVETFEAQCPECGAGFHPDDYPDPTVARCVSCGSPLYPGERLTSAST